MLILLAFAADARTLGVGHLSDDWVVLGHVARHGNAEAWTGPWLGARSLLFHRPVATGLYALELGLFGAAALPAHVHHLAWHLLAVALLYLLLRQLGASRGAAFLGGLLFAWQPYIAHATGWLAARGGTVSWTLTLLTIVAWLRYRARGGRAIALLAFVSAGLAALTRESGYLALLAPLTADLVWVRPWRGVRRLLGPAAAFGALGVGLLALRYVALGTVVGGYQAGQGLFAGPDGPSGALRVFVEALGRLGLGIPSDVAWEGLSGMLEPATAVATALLLVGAVWLGRRAPWPSRALGVLGAWLLPQLLLLLVTGPTLSPATGQRWYGALALVCGILALLASPLLAPRRWWWVVPLPVLYLVGHLALQERLLEADRLARDVLMELEARLETLPADTTAVFVSGLPEAHIGLPTLQWGLVDALRPPFRTRAPAVPIYPVHRFMELADHRGAFAAPHLAWPFHPPAELLLWETGRLPVALRYAEADGRARLDALDISSWGPPEAVAARLETLFPAGRFALQGATGAVPRPIDPAAPALDVTVPTEGLSAVVFFCFSPEADMRLRMPVEGSFLTADLWPKLGDFARLHGGPTDLYVVPVGERQSDHALLLGPLTTFRWP